MNSPLVSVIIPVYNVEEYLRECVNSVINQSYRNLEIWLVDDGSQDASGKICDEYKEKDERIRVIHKENGGLSSARNSAIDLMNGEYVVFIDSDDFIANDFIETYVDYMNRFDVDIVMGTWYPFYGEIKDQTKYILYDNKPELYKKIDAIKMMFLDRKLYHDAAGPMYKSFLFKNIRFPIGVLYEDLATTFYVVSGASNILYVNDQRQFYRIRPGSIMNATVKKDDMVILKILPKVVGDMVALYPEVEKEANRKLIVVCLKFYSRILYSGFNNFPEEKNYIKEIIKKYGKNFVESGLAKKSDIVKISAFNVGDLPFYLVYKISDYIQLKRRTLK